MGRVRYRLHPLIPPGEGRGEGIEQVHVSHLKIYHYRFFDALVSTGVFTRKQVPLNAFDELIRILKPNGFFVVVLRIEDNDFYYNRLNRVS